MLKTCKAFASRLVSLMSYLFSLYSGNTAQIDWSSPAKGSGDPGAAALLNNPSVQQALDALLKNGPSAGPGKQLYHTRRSTNAMEFDIQNLQQGLQLVDRQVVGIPLSQDLHGGEDRTQFDGKIAVLLLRMLH